MLLFQFFFFSICAPVFISFRSFVCLFACFLSSYCSCSCFFALFLFFLFFFLCSFASNIFFLFLRLFIFFLSLSVFQNSKHFSVVYQSRSYHYLSTLFFQLQRHKMDGVDFFNLFYIKNNNNSNINKI